MNRRGGCLTTAAPFRWLPLVLATVLGQLPRAAGADPGLYLSWNDCPLSASSLASLSGACLNSAQEMLVVSFELPAPTDSVIELDAVVDVQSQAATLPFWWQYGPGGCRYGALVASADFTGFSACSDFWQGAATFDGPPVYSAGAPRGVNQARIVVSFSLLSSQFRALAAGTRYYAARLVIQNDPVAACSGCEIPACLLLNSIHVGRLPGSVGGDVLLEAAGTPGSNRATWQSTLADCSAVPVRRRSWGQLKTLYR